MKEITLNKFKAFNNQITIGDLDKYSTLIYGINGSGKSSITEAFKLIFFKDKLLKLYGVNVMMTKEERENKEKEFLDNYNNKKDVTKSFNITVDGNDYSEYNAENDNVSVITNQDLYKTESIILYELYEKSFINVSDLSTYLSNNADDIVKTVNSLLNDYFHENIIVELDNKEKYTCRIIDDKKGLKYVQNINVFFNEAKINLIKILFLFCLVLRSFDKSRTNILIIDDLITSLDDANRTLMASFILENFNEFRIYFFTHNVNFYNMFMYSAKVKSCENNWKFRNLYEFNEEHIITEQDSYKRSFKIREDYSKNRNINTTGNEIRRSFEILLHELSKKTISGYYENTKSIIDSIYSSKHVYLKKNGKDVENVYNLVEYIQSYVNSGVDNKKKINEIKRILQEFESNNSMPNIKQIISNLRIYQKFALHPASHGVMGVQPFNKKEIQISIELLSQLEKIVG